METQNTQVTVKGFFQREDVKSKFQELLGNRSTQFITSLMSIVNNSSYLKNTKPDSIYTAAMMAAALDLPINQNLGFAYIIPYNDKNNGQVAQFQIGYKGLIQLALRSGQFKTISACPVYEGQLVSENPLTGFVFDFSKKTSETIIGYASYFSLLNGFEKTLFLTKEQAEKHGRRFSANYKKYGTGLWKDDFDGMSLKTVLKMLLSKYAPLSIEMQKAVIADQSVINSVEDMDVEYVDNNSEEKVQIDTTERINKLKEDGSK